MKGTWEHWSKQIFGYVEKQTPTNERYVALQKIQHYLDEGYNEAQIARLWNQGNASPCKSGTNKWGVKYDSCAYQEKVLAKL
jgi:hypothetical protein